MLASENPAQSDRTATYQKGIVNATNDCEMQVELERTSLTFREVADHGQFERFPLKRFDH